jgi:predicted ATP-binding protein involved in virulence
MLDLMSLDPSHGAKIGIAQLSQGTNSILGWAGTSLQRIYEIHGHDKDIKLQSAVVLIDEIDAHLHPDWQRRIVGALSEQFRAVQFIATTHSPLIVGELEQHQVYRMEQQPDGEIVATRPTHPLKGLGVAGLLTSAMFGLTSTLDQKTQALLEQQRALSASEELTEADKVKLEEVNAQLEGLGFWYQMRDPEYTRYLKERDQLIQEQGGSQPTAREEPPPAVKELIKKAVQATQSGR